MVGQRGIFKTETEADDFIADLNAQGFPIIGTRNGVSSPETQQITGWVGSATRVQSNLWTVLNVPEDKRVMFNIPQATLDAVDEANRNNTLDFTGANATLPALSTSGNKLQANGFDVHLRGISLAEAGKEYGGKWGVDYATEGMPQFVGANVIRIPCQPTHMETLYTMQSYIAYFVDPIVEWAETNSLYCIIDFHAIENWNTTAVDTELQAFWDIAALRYKNLPHVLFEIFNEPASPTNGASSWADFKPTVQGWVDYVRAIAPNNIILVPTPSYCQYIEQAAASPLTGTNLVYVEHIYPAHMPGGSILDSGGSPVAATTLATKVAFMDGKFGTPSASVPIIVTEWGYNLAANASDFYLLNAQSDDSFGQPLTDYLNEYGIHWTAWDLSPTSAPSLISDETTFTLRPFGLLTQAQVNISPSSVTGGQAWYTSTEGVTSATNLVSDWTDELGLAADATESTNKPTTNVTTINGYNAIDFADNTMTLPSLFDAGNAAAETIFVVFKATVNQTNPLITSSTGGSDNYGLKSGTSNRIKYNAYGTTIQSPTGGSYDTLTHVAIGWNDGVNMKCYKDGGTPGTVAVGTPVALNGPPYLGNRAFNAEHLDGSILDVAKFNVALTADEINRILRGFAYKYGVVITEVV